jgi:hypothetical protein
MFLTCCFRVAQDWRHKKSQAKARKAGVSVSTVEADLFFNGQTES